MAVGVPSGATAALSGGEERPSLTTVAPSERDVTKNTDVIRGPWCDWFRGVWARGGAA